jgi:hypothetical protein
MFIITIRLITVTFMSFVFNDIFRHFNRTFVKQAKQTHFTRCCFLFQTLQKDIAVNRESMIKLDKTGTHLKYFSQKQDVVLIKNLLSSVQQRWEKIVSRSAERTRHLERGYKEAEQVKYQKFFYVIAMIWGK